jgi:hypothetical protein
MLDADCIVKKVYEVFAIVADELRCTQMTFPIFINLSKYDSVL